MKANYFLFLLILFPLTLLAQKKEFEGILTYKVDVKSKKPEFSDKYWKNILGAGDNVTVQVKQGNYLRQSGMVTEYHNPKQEKVYMKFEGIDTLFYQDYSSDSSTLINISKSNETKKIAGYDCNAITIKTSSATRQYYYAPLLYSNPVYDKNNKISRFDIYISETSSIYLSESSEYESFTYSEFCTSVEQKSLNESAFKLPEFPIVKFNYEYLLKPPEFNRSGGWIKYLQANLKKELGAKYVKIPKGQDEAMVTVIVQFIVSRTGEVKDVKAINKQEVHPRLAEEAIRVVSESGRWKPATYLNEKIDQVMKQPITFAVSKG